ncbi:MAG TPA: ferritin-like domain-containing protein [Candidatus Tectomicrobia bacterium]|jgi:hypothetical protein
MRQHLTIGSQEHKELLCRFFLDSHQPFDPATVSWPTLDEASLTRLRSLPFWAEAVATECLTACTITTWAAQETDALLREAIALQGYEERRHAALLQGLTAHYGIVVPPQPEPQPPADAEWAFLCTGYSECFDAFFTFALFTIARDSGFFPPALVERFEPIMQEEARHILFFVNWEAYHQARRPLWQRPQHVWRGALGRGLQVWHRLQTARGLRQGGDFTIKGHQSLQATMSPRRFLELCLQENTRRLARYDARLLRPRLVPALARALRRVLG